MGHYSIDLGIHPDATGGHKGSVGDPFPMQIALVEGKLLKDPESGRYKDFQPTKLASFYQIRAKDIIIFRIFETTSVSTAQNPVLEDVKSVQIRFTDLIGNPADKPWKIAEKGFDAILASTQQLSLAFTSKPEGMYLPCWFEQGSPNGLVTYEVAPPKNLKDPDSLLFSVTVETTRIVGSELNTFYHQDDPEMVVSPDESPGCEKAAEDCLPAQVPVIAAMSL
ncbi:MAG TPA: hypothetical protein VJ885_02645 [Thermoanaerobaculia bacterium]|jgi:hypothetical protein|nr:hypothetical protein [Thermoanaerobaculia bacterium]